MDAGLPAGATLARPATEPGATRPSNRRPMYSSPSGKG
jgi:hypothetical protein